MLADDLQDLCHVDINSVPVPPFLFAVVTCKEQNLGAVGQEMFDFDHIRLRALGAVHIDFVAAWGRHMLRPTQSYNNEPSSRRRPT